MVSEKVCIKCLGDPQPLENFHRNRAREDGRSGVCKSCSKQVHRDYYLKNQAELIAKQKARYREDPETTLARVQKWAEDNRERSNDTKRRWKQRNPEYEGSEEARRRQREARARRRREAIETMGSMCACCGENDWRLLTFDHVGGWGAEHRRQLSHANFISWLTKHHYPKGNETCPTCGEVHEGIQLLCFTCNMATTIYGTCPHQEPSIVALAA